MSIIYAHNLFRKSENTSYYNRAIHAMIAATNLKATLPRLASGTVCSVNNMIIHFAVDCSFFGDNFADLCSLYGFIEFRIMGL